MFSALVTMRELPSVVPLVHVGLKFLKAIRGKSTVIGRQVYAHHVRLFEEFGKPCAERF